MMLSADAPKRSVSLIRLSPTTVAARGPTATANSSET